MKRALFALVGIIVVMISASSFAGVCGDVNGTGTLNLQDVSHLINYLYRSGPAPICDPEFTTICGDVNGDEHINLLDVNCIIDYLYRGGPAPFCGIVTDIDGNTYEAVKIGDQWWMAENLKVTHYRNNDGISNITSSTTWLSFANGAYCNYDNDTNNVATYGRLYNWNAVNDNRNIAPAGWHVPTDAEWKQLEMYLGMTQEQADSINCWRGSPVGDKLKEAGTTHWYNNNQGATNSSGFTAIGSGYRSVVGGAYNSMTVYADYWTSTEYDGDNTNAWSRHLGCSESTVYRVCGESSDKHCGFSIRCVKD